VKGLERVTRLARLRVERWGMSERLGPVSILPPEATLLFPTSGEVSEATRRLVDEEVRRIVDSCHEEALAVLRAHRDRLEALATVLLERETIDEDEVYRIARVEHPEAAHPPSGA
jgi:cell division protease FtsH